MKMWNKETLLGRLISLSVPCTTSHPRQNRACCLKYCFMSLEGNRYNKCRVHICIICLIGKERSALRWWSFFICHLSWQLFAASTRWRSWQPRTFTMTTLHQSWRLKLWTPSMKNWKCGAGSGVIFRRSQCAAWGPRFNKEGGHWPSLLIWSPL